MSRKNPPILRPGKIESFSQNNHGISGRTGNDILFEITVYSSSIIRVRFTRDEFDDHSYAVVAQPAGEFTLSDDKKAIVLQTDLLACSISRETCEVTFSDLKGNVLNQDEEGLGISWIGEQVTNYKTMQDGERFVGLGEKVGPLDRKGQGYQHWNTDSFAYGPGTDPLYCSIPFYIGIHGTSAYGLFMDNSHKSFFNFGASNNRFSSFSADQGDLNYYFIYEGTVPGILEAYTWLTGRMKLPPFWGLGYQQCRYSYYPESEVRMVADTFRSKDIPADAIVLDIHYMDKYKIFTWDEERFPDPGALVQDLRNDNFHIVVMCDPGIKVEDDYSPYESGVEKDVFLKYPDGELYQGEVWPGWCHFPDFTREETRNWWKEHFPAYVDLGVDGFWNDMNEIATWGQMVPENVLFDFEGNPDTMRKGRNVYGLCMARSTCEATEELTGKRTFNLTRSAYAGIQRYSAVWTGDNVANDEHMMLGIRLVNSMGLSGISYAGFDVGGFVGNASEHLFARWIQAGAFSPFYRGHSMINSRDSEPWAFGEEVEQVSRNYIRLRYKLIMYLYSMFYESTLNGMPVCRSLVLEYPHDPKIYEPAFENQYLFGQSILVAPHESYKQITKVYLPEGDWYEFFSNEYLKGGQTIFTECPINKFPLYVKASAILPVCPEIGNSSAQTGDVLEFHIFKGEETNSFTYYEDDGESFSYESGEFMKRDITYLPQEEKLIFSKPEGGYSTKFSTFKLVLHGFDCETVSINGQSVKMKLQDYRFVDPIPSFDPFYPDIDDSLDTRGLRFADLELTREQLEISFG